MLTFGMQVFCVIFIGISLGGIACLIKQGLNDLSQGLEDIDER